MFFKIFPIVLLLTLAACGPGEEKYDAPAAAGAAAGEPQAGPAEDLAIEEPDWS
jgi:hypothetical protein